MESRERLEIRTDDLSNAKVIGLVKEHLEALAPTAPPESRHALDLSGLRGPDITFWAIWHGKELAGIGALKHLSPDHAEIKSMKTARPYLRRGVARTMLSHLVSEAGKRGYTQVSLETGSMDYFAPARNLYLSFGFSLCAPFGSYREDPNSVFMTKQLTDHI